MLEEKYDVLIMELKEIVAEEYVIRRSESNDAIRYNVGIEQTLEENIMHEEFNDVEHSVKWGLVQCTMDSTVCKKKWKTPNALLFEIDQRNGDKIRNYSRTKNVLSAKEVKEQ